MPAAALYRQNPMCLYTRQLEALMIEGQTAAQSLHSLCAAHQSQRSFSWSPCRAVTQSLVQGLVCSQKLVSIRSSLTPCFSTMALTASPISGCPHSMMPVCPASVMGASWQSQTSIQP